jgi:F1F0 ATPase subunit 2
MSEIKFVSESLILLTEPLPLLVESLAAGILLGALFFGGLWWTVRRGLTAANPALWFGLSALARMALVLGVLYYIARAGWTSLLACLCGMLIARVVVARLTRNVG